MNGDVVIYERANYEHLKSDTLLKENIPEGISVPARSTRPHRKVTSTTKNQSLTFELLGRDIVAIVGILSAVAIPQYREHVREGCRTDFMAALEKVANEQEQFYYDRNTFSGFIASLPVSPNSERGHYAITTSLVGGDTDTYRALAVPLNGDCLSASDRRYRLDHTGRKEHKDTSGNWTLGWDY